MSVRTFAATLALGLAHYAAAESINSGLSRNVLARANQAGDSQVIEFPAVRMRGLEGHNGKRQVEQRTASTGLQTTESWYWSLDGQPIGNYTLNAETDEKRFLSMERFADAIANTECTGSDIVFTFNDEAAYAEAQESWTWMNQAERSVGLVLEPGICGNEKRQCYLATGVDVAGGAEAQRSGVEAPTVGNSSIASNSTISNSSSRVMRKRQNNGSLQITVQATESTWEEIGPQGIVHVDTRGIVTNSSTVAIDRRQEESRSSLNLDKANIRDRRLINFDPFQGAGSNVAPARADGDNVPASDRMEENDPNRAPFYLGCRFCGLRGGIDFVSTLSFDLIRPLTGGDVVEGTLDIIPVFLEAEVRLELGLGLEVPFPDKVDFELALGQLNLITGGIPIGGFNFGPSLALDFVSAIGPLEGTAGVNMALIVDVPENPVGRFDFGPEDKFPRRESTGWTPRARIEGPDLTGSLGFTSSIGPRLRLQVGIGIGDFSANAGVQLEVPRLSAEFQAEASTANTACGDSQVGVSAGVRVDGPLSAFAEVLGNEVLNVPIAELFQVDILPSTCIEIVGGEATPAPDPADPNQPPPLAETTSAAAPAPPAEEPAFATGSVTMFNDNCCSDGTCDSFGSQALVAPLPVGVCTITIHPAGALRYRTTSNNSDALCEFQYFSDVGCTQPAGIAPSNNDQDGICLAPPPAGAGIVAMVMNCF